MTPSALNDPPGETLEGLLAKLHSRSLKGLLLAKLKRRWISRLASLTRRARRSGPVALYDPQRRAFFLLVTDNERSQARQLPFAVSPSPTTAVTTILYHFAPAIISSDTKDDRQSCDLPELREKDRFDAVSPVPDVECVYFDIDTLACMVNDIRRLSEGEVLYAAFKLALQMTSARIRREAGALQG